VPLDDDPRVFPPVAVTVDIVVLTIVDGELRVLLVERALPPFEGALALPGGFVQPDETLADAAARELQEETSVRAKPFLEQLGAYGDPGRDPRMRVVTVAYLAIVPSLGPIAAATDARAALLVPVTDVAGRRIRHKLAFDHQSILEAAVERARSKLEYTSIATEFLGKTFTLSELRAVYEAAWGERLDPGNFRRKVLGTPGFVLPTGAQGTPGPEGGKPPDLYKKGKAVTLQPPLTRPH
jgi:8-oxo-dGTP diphosphatase